MKEKSLAKLIGDKNLYFRTRTLFRIPCLAQIARPSINFWLSMRNLSGSENQIGFQVRNHLEELIVKKQTSKSER